MEIFLGVHWLKLPQCKKDYFSVGSYDEALYDEVCEEIQYDEWVSIRVLWVVINLGRSTR